MQTMTHTGLASVVETRPEHLAQMVTIFAHGQDQHHTTFPDIFGAPDNDAKIMDYLRSYLKPRNPMRTRRNFSLSWMVDNEVGGFILYQLYSTANVFYGRQRWICFIEDIAIDPVHRSKGGASALLESLLEQVKELDNCIVNAQVWRGNEASNALFRKYGFDDKAMNFCRVL